MLRQLLTLLAVISGFTLAAEPVSAAEAGMVSVATAAEIGEHPASLPVAVELTATAQTEAVVSDKGCEQRPAISPAPTVQLQADRARE